MTITRDMTLSSAGASEIGTVRGDRNGLRVRIVRGVRLGAGGANRDGLRVRIVGVVRQVCVVGCGFRRLRFERIDHTGVAGPS